MYNHIGAKIKGLVKIIVIIGFVCVGIMGFVTMITSIINEAPSGILTGLLEQIIGAFLVWVAGFLLYGFGELVDNSTKMREMMEKKNDKENKE